MAAVRKSDFTGDTFGSWRVTERADAVEGKRRWSVVNDVTGEVRTVLQTELKHLEKVPNVIDGRNDLGQRVHGDADPIYVNAESNWERDGGTVEATEINVGVFMEDVTYEPRGENAESALIARKVIEGNVDDWTRDLPVEIPDEHVLDESDVQSSIDHRDDQLGGIGAQAEAGVTEAELDERVPAQDPMRAAIRAVMGTTVDLRNAQLALGGAAEQLNYLVTDLQMAYDSLMEKLDLALKCAITR